jgi:hypothetical protein
MVHLVKKNVIRVLVGLMLAAIISLGGCGLTDFAQNIVNSVIGGCCKFDVWSVGL